MLRMTLLHVRENYSTTVPKDKRKNRGVYGNGYTVRQTVRGKTNDGHREQSFPQPRGREQRRRPG
jgi:hypothetical protein